ncbi:NADH dehydrogenase [ubiquinone] 1 beta subcomplex subunit 4-like [Eriocheir sinensis]|uniref:NADH dehydrogenase [ubiquinone] 1 beta subcomplex subunit 4-like n=1 Tax=Eriocheir sinensis TaxID=95602 RepID=UPI0021C682E6|nr:NADH dehydrogenase [ubiquinone] 1 beta subcomplex subunit 4-like [Eriocheir sinensis]
MSDPRSPEAIRERAALKVAMKREFQKQVHNPHRHGSGEAGYLFDPAVQRFMSMRATQYDFFRPTPKASLLGFLAIVVPIASYAWLLKRDKDQFEAKCRSGQISYADRNYKFY